jgi:alanine-alpha-ketoisovalerate/valine-pyruvate aminotransferase
MVSKIKKKKPIIVDLNDLENYLTNYYKKLKKEKKYPDYMCDYSEKRDKKILRELLIIILDIGYKYIQEEKKLK